MKPHFNTIRISEKPEMIWGALRAGCAKIAKTKRGRILPVRDHTQYAATSESKNSTHAMTRQLQNHLR